MEGPSWPEVRDGFLKEMTSQLSPDREVKSGRADYKQVTGTHRGLWRLGGATRSGKWKVSQEENPGQNGGEFSWGQITNLKFN